MTKPVSIYLLRDPRNNEVRYVGKTVRGLSLRLRGHICRTNLTPKRHSSRWIAGLVKEGLAPSIEEIEVVPQGGDWQERERFWIAEYRRRGARLTNLADGGEGVAGVRFTEERRREQSERFKGRVFDDEWKAKISAAKKGAKIKPPTPEATAKRAASLRATNAAKPVRTHCFHGHALTPGKKSCAECKRDYFQRTYVPSQQTIEERRAVLDEVRNRPEVRAKMSASAKRRWADQELRNAHSEARKGHTWAPSGVKHHAAKLDWEKVQDIRQRCSNGETRAAMAKKHGVSPAVVDRVVWGLSWKKQSA